jgi:hypothetical protein
MITRESRESAGRKSEVRRWEERPGTVREPRGRETSAVESRYQATVVKTVIENIGLCVTVICKVV